MLTCVPPVLCPSACCLPGRPPSTTKNTPASRPATHRIPHPHARTHSRAADGPWCEVRPAAAGLPGATLLGPGPQPQQTRQAVGAGRLRPAAAAATPVGAVHGGCAAAASRQPAAAARDGDAAGWAPAGLGHASTAAGVCACCWCACIFVAAHNTHCAVAPATLARRHINQCLACVVSAPAPHTPCFCVPALSACVPATVSLPCLRVCVCPCLCRRSCTAPPCMRTSPPATLPPLPS